MEKDKEFDSGIDIDLIFGNNGEDKSIETDDWTKNQEKLKSNFKVFNKKIAKDVNKDRYMKVIVN